MTDQTPDPWQDIRVAIILKDYDASVLCGRIAEALAAERAQHQQEKDAAWNALHVRDQALLDAHDQVAQRDETIRQQAEQITTLTQELKEAQGDRHELALIVARVGERGRTDASTPTFIRVENIIERAEAAEAAEARCATLTAALEQLRDCDWTIGRGDRMDAVRDIARTALSGVSTP